MISGLAVLQSLTLLSSSTFGFGGAPLLMTIVTHAVLLTVFEIPQDRPLAIHFSRLGSARVSSLATAQSVFTNLAFAAFSFALGKIAWQVYDLF
jgi:hypothetical protein